MTTKTNKTFPKTTTVYQAMMFDDIEGWVSADIESTAKEAVDDLDNYWEVGGGDTIYILEITVPKMETKTSPLIKTIKVAI